MGNLHRWQKQRQQQGEAYDHAAAAEAGDCEARKL